MESSFAEDQTNSVAESVGRQVNFVLTFYFYSYFNLLLKLKTTIDYKKFGKYKNLANNIIIIAFKYFIKNTNLKSAVQKLSL